MAVREVLKCLEAVGAVDEVVLDAEYLWSVDARESDRWEELEGAAARRIVLLERVQTVLSIGWLCTSRSRGELHDGNASRVGFSLIATVPLL